MTITQRTGGMNWEYTKFLMLHLKQKLSFEDRLTVTKDVYCRH